MTCPILYQCIHNKFHLARKNNEFPKILNSTSINYLITQFFHHVPFPSIFPTLTVQNDPLHTGTRHKVYLLTPNKRTTVTYSFILNHLHAKYSEKYQQIYTNNCLNYDNKFLDLSKFVTCNTWRVTFLANSSFFYFSTHLTIRQESPTTINAVRTCSIHIILSFHTILTLCKF